MDLATQIASIGEHLTRMAYESDADHNESRLLSHKALRRPLCEDPQLSQITSIQLFAALQAAA